ncbi:MAG: restriction endonuclease subunit S [Cupriavidus sp.]|nr:restriction endonuclease subunit S [Cupriavidus sp.]
MKYATYSEYKPSHVDWLGDVPSHWAVKAIKWESPVLRGASPRPIDDPVYFDDDGEYAWVRIADVTEAGTYLEYTEQNLSDIGARLSVKLKPGDLFLSIAGSVGKPCITRIKCCIHDGFVYFPRWKSDPKFLYYLFASGEPYKGLGKMGTQLNLNTDTVGSIVIGLPDADEQKTITRFLDTKTAQIDALVAQKRQLIDKLKEKRQALIARTVTRGLPPEAAKAAGLEPKPEMKDSGADWLTEIPANWQLSPLKRIVCTPITDGPHETPEFPLEGVPFVSAEAVQDGRVILSSMRGYISQEDHERYSRKYCPRKNDIFIVKSGSTTGKVAIVDFDDVFNVWSPLAAVRCDLQKALPEFIFFALSSEYFQGLIQVSWSFGTQPNIGMGVIGNLAVVLPPVAEQRLIADFLRIETERMNGLIERAQIAIARLTEYRQALITSAVTGKIDVRELA